MHTLTEDYLLSTLKETNTISDKNGYRISVVKDVVDDTVYIKKQFKTAAGLNTHRALLKIDHVNLPKTFHVIETEDGFIVLEEYVHGATLKTALTGNPLPTEKMAEISLQLCNVLELLHNETPPLIHRDVNPSNIIVTADGIVKLIDFNAAKEYKPDTIEDTTTLGTKAYAAPEQYGYAKTDARTDIYCLGATMYHMLTGKLYVNGGETSNSKLYMIVNKCLQIDPNNRYSDILSLKMDLEVVLFGYYKSNGNKKRQLSFFPDFHSASSNKKILLTVLYTVLSIIVLVFTFVAIGDAQNMRDMIESWTLLVFIFFIPYLLICNVYGIRSKLPLFKEGSIMGTIIGTIIMAVLLIVFGSVGFFFASFLS